MCPQRTYKTEHLTQQNVLRKWFIAWIDLYFCPPSEFVTPLTIFMLTPQHLLFYIFVIVFFCPCLHCLFWSGLGVGDFSYIVFSNDSHFHFFLLIDNPHLLSFKQGNKGTHFLFGGDGSKYYR